MGEASHQLVHALDHFLRSLVSERHRQNRFRHHPLIFDEIGDAEGYDPGLAAARARENEDRPVRSFNGGALLRVELVKKRQNWGGSGSPVQFYRGTTIGGFQSRPRSHQLSQSAANSQSIRAIFEIVGVDFCSVSSISVR